MRRIVILLVTAVLAGVATTAAAGIITSSLGNTASGFADGSTQAAFLVGGAQGGQPAPFDTGYGTDGLFGGNFSQTWTHSYSAIADPILSAMITIGIYDHDSIATGSQLAYFGHGTSDLTTGMDTLFEAGGGSADATYNEYSLALTDFADLADGSVDFFLDLMGPGLVPRAVFLGGGFEETSTNGANLIFATLTIVTEDQQPPQPVPEPGGLALLGAGLLSLGLQRRSRRFRRRAASE